MKEDDDDLCDKRVIKVADSHTGTGGSEGLDDDAEEPSSLHGLGLKHFPASIPTGLKSQPPPTSSSSSSSSSAMDDSTIQSHPPISDKPTTNNIHEISSDAPAIWSSHSNSSTTATPTPPSSSLLPSPFPLTPPLSNAFSSLATSTDGRDSPVDASLIENVLTVGTRMIKFPSKASSRPEERMIKVDLPHLQVTWDSRKKKPARSTADFHAIREIRLGQNTKAFDLHGKSPSLEERAFSVIYSTPSGEYKTLNLLAPTKEDCALWVTGLHMLLAQHESSTPTHGGGEEVLLHKSVGTWLKTMWDHQDVMGSGKLDLDGVTSLMKKLNIKLSRIEVKSTFKNADISRKGYLNFDAFERLYKALRFRPEIGGLFSSLARSNPSYITLEEFERFLVEVQKMNWTKPRVAEVYHKYSSEENYMDMDHFSAFLISANNSIFRKLHTTVYQDMNQPLCNYFINSSHNTYLLGDQLTGESSIEGYIRALQKGCRCLELDCFDGPQGPLIYHKNSLTNKILFREVVEAINRYAFVASPYPLFLSFENHCSLEQQAIMAQILLDVFGDALYHEPCPPDQRQLPSPNSLMRKVIIKGRTTQSLHIEESLDDEEDDDLILPQALSSPPLTAASESSSIPVTCSPPSVLIRPRPLLMTRPRVSSFAASHDASISSSSNIMDVDHQPPGTNTSSGNHDELMLSRSLPSLSPLSSQAMKSDSHSLSRDFSGTSSAFSSAAALLLESSDGGGGVTTTGGTTAPAHDELPRKKPSTGRLIRTGSMGVMGFNSSTIAGSGTMKRRKRLPIDKSLSDLVVLCKAVRFTGVRVFEVMRFNEMCSIPEHKATPLLQRKRDGSLESRSQSTSPTQTEAPKIILSKLSSTMPPPSSSTTTSATTTATTGTTSTATTTATALDLWMHNQTHLTRIYPAPLRLNSSNFDPLSHWFYGGSQMVAMNFQTFDRGMQINTAWFAGNGGCGFILRPPSVVRGGTTARNEMGAGKMNDFGTIRRRGPPPAKPLPSGLPDDVEGVPSNVMNASMIHLHNETAAPATAIAAGTAGGGYNKTWTLRRVHSGENPDAKSTSTTSAPTATTNLNSWLPHMEMIVTPSSLIGQPSNKAFDMSATMMTSSSSLPGAALVSVTVISAQQLTRVKEESSRSVVDPFVEVEMVGCDQDCARARTKNSTSSGFNPTWRETFRFVVTAPDMALLRFQVFDGESKLLSDSVGNYTIALCNLEQGYRHAPLLNRRGETIRFSTLFLFIAFSDIAGAG